MKLSTLLATLDEDDLLNVEVISHDKQNVYWMAYPIHSRDSKLLNSQVAKVKVSSHSESIYNGPFLRIFLAPPKKKEAD